MIDRTEKFIRSWIPFLIFLSGMAGLIYEVVWMRMLIRVFGITLYATCTIISVYMGGLALGSWFFGKYYRKRKLGFKTYGFIEILISGTALLTTLLIQFLPDVYSSLINPIEMSNGSHFFNTSLRVILTIIAMLIPTALMGSTLPILTQLITSSLKKIGSKTGLLYGANTLGAVFGILFAGFISIGVLGEWVTVFIAAFLDLFVGVTLFFYGPAKRYFVNETPPPPVYNEFRVKFDVAFLLIVSISGFVAIGLEVLWVRILILLLGTSVYAFSTMLALYLFGVGIGSLLMVKLSKRINNPILVFGYLQGILAVLGIISLWIYSYIGQGASDFKYLYSPIQNASDIFNLFGFAAVIITPITIILGMMFPLSARIISENRGHAGESVGTLYAWNTIGGVLGSIACAFFLIPLIGVQASFISLCMLSLVLGFVCIALWVTLKKMTHLLKFSAIALIAILLFPSSYDIYLSILINRLKDGRMTNILFHQEDSIATLTGIEVKGSNKFLDAKFLLINGIFISGTSQVGDLMAHLPLLLHPNPQNALIICFGVGNAFRSAIDHVGRVDSVELIQGVVDTFESYDEDADFYLNHPGARIFINDGRNYLLTTDNKYDMILVDGAPPIFSEGFVNLYSYDFLKLAKSRLTEKGVMTVWAPTPCFEENFWMIAKNFQDLFMYTRAWTSPEFGGIILMGSQSPIDLDNEEILRRHESRGLGNKKTGIPAKMFNNTWELSDREIRKYARNYKRVTDQHPYTEFPLLNFIQNKKFWDSTEFILKAKIK